MKRKYVCKQIKKISCNLRRTSFLVRKQRNYDAYRWGGRGIPGPHQRHNSTASCRSIHSDISLWVRRTCARAPTINTDTLHPHFHSSVHFVHPPPPTPSTSTYPHCPVYFKVYLKSPYTIHFDTTNQKRDRDKDFRHLLPNINVDQGMLFFCKTTNKSCGCCECV